MTKQLKNILKGVGSVMNISPRNDYRRFIPKESAGERMKGHWERTGHHIKRAIDRFAHEQKEQK